jgi:NTP pyrophosphatase (non-canonical NTP hydrolase)
MEEEEVVSKSCLEKLTLDKWADELWGLYKDQNVRRSVPEVWLSVAQFSSEIAEGIRKTECLEINRAIAHTFCWLCAFYNRCAKAEPQTSPFYIKEKFWEVIAFKFPGVCGRCGSDPCSCGLNRMALDFRPSNDLHRPELERIRKNFDASNYTLTRWESMFNRIFGNSIYRSSLESIGFHLMEETGEVAKSIRKLTEMGRGLSGGEVDSKKGISKAINKERERLMEELADTVSFLYSLATRESFLISGIKRIGSFDRRLSIADEYLVKAVISHYSDREGKKIRCPDCYNNPCTC